MPTMTISSSASPTALSSTRRKAGVNICASALAAASIMRAEVSAGCRPRGKRRYRVKAAGDSGSRAAASSSAGTSATNSSRSAAEQSIQAIAL